jgi:EthD domain
MRPKSVVELWFDSAEDVEKAFTAPRYLEVIRPDERNFIDLAAASIRLPMHCRFARLAARRIR